MADKDLYSILGISKNATADEIKSAYRAKAKEFHPDKYANKPDAERKAAEEKFKDVQHAYDVLSDEQKRANYDQYGSEEGPFAGGGSGFNPFGGSGDPFSDIFNMFGGFGRQQRQQDYSGEDIKVQLKISFKEVCFGSNDKEISYSRKERCPVCSGTGGKTSSSVVTCTKCGGRGRIIQNVQTFIGSVRQERVCPDCSGSGKIIKDPCRNCSGKGIVKVNHTTKINFPAGLQTGNTISKRGEGSASPIAGQPNGDLFIKIVAEDSKLYVRDDFDLMYIYPITIFQATLGDKVKVPTIYGEEELNIPAGTQSGQIFTLKGKGLTNYSNKRKGDLHIQVNIEIPKNMSFGQKAQFKEMASKLSDIKYDNI